MSTIIDFHTHILPGVDDGSQTAETSTEMLKAEAEQGIEHVIFTPHFYPKSDSLEAFLDRRASAAEILHKKIGNTQNYPCISLGAEVYYFRGISDSLVLSDLTIAGTNCMMIEMPQAPWTEVMYNELYELKVKQGITPIIAHVDRYISPFRTYHIPQRLAELPVLVQANASFFLRPTTRLMALKLLKEGKIHLLGSDCHNMTTRPPNIGAALAIIERHLGLDFLEDIMACQADIFTGQTIIL